MQQTQRTQTLLCLLLFLRRLGANAGEKRRFKEERSRLCGKTGVRVRLQVEGSSNLSAESFFPHSHQPGSKQTVLTHRCECAKKCVPGVASGGGGARGHRRRRGNGTGSCDAH